MRTFKATALGAGLAMLAVSADCRAQFSAWQPRLEGVAPGADFGAAVALDYSVGLVGAPGDDEAGENAGAVYVFTHGGGGPWIFQQKLFAADASPGAEFGASLALSQGVALIGAPGAVTADGYGGAAYVFALSGTSWTPVQRLVASDPSARFGAAVALSGATALIGAPHSSGNIGAAYAFVRSGDEWQQQVKLTAADGAQFDTFGAAVALSGDTAVVGAPLDDGPSMDAGSVYVFVRSGGSWGQLPKLTAPGAQFDDHFGSALAVEGDTAFIGAPRKDTPWGFNSGCVYVFGRSVAGSLYSPWSSRQTLQPSAGASGSTFGNALSLDGEQALLGARGAAFHFRRSANGAWQERQRLAAYDSIPGNDYGMAVAVFHDEALVGAPSAEAAYAYIVPQPLPPPPAGAFGAWGLLALLPLRWRSRSLWTLMQPSRAFAQTLAGLLSALALVASFDARAEGAAGPLLAATPSPTAQEIEAAITEQSERRSNGTSAIVIGGIAIAGGVIASVVKMADDCGIYDCSNGNEWDAALVGLGIGIPFIVGGVLTIVDSGRKARELRQQRSHLSVSPGPDSLKLTLAYEF